MLLEAVASQQDDYDGSGGDDSGGSDQLTLDSLIKPVDWPEDKNWGTLSIDASCTPADIAYPTDLKLLNEVRQSTERLVDDLCRQSSAFTMLRSRYDRRKAQAHFLSVAKQKKPRCRKIKTAVKKQLSYLLKNLTAIDALIAAGASFSGLKHHWWQKLLACSEPYRQQTVLLYSNTKSIPDRLVSLVQRWVRPIVRGKARATVEFGAVARRASAGGKEVSRVRTNFHFCTG